MPAEPKPTPLQIVEPDGRVNTGWFDRPIERVNLDSAHPRHLLSALRSTPLALAERQFRRLRLKRWHYCSIVTPRAFFACAIVDAGYVGTAFAYVVDRQSGAMHEYTTLQPFGRGIRIAANSLDGTTAVDVPAWGRIELHNDSEGGIRRVDAKLEGRLGPDRAPPLRVQFEMEDCSNNPDPVVVVEQPTEGRWFYTHKCYGLPVGGTLHCGSLDEQVAMGEALGGIDWNCGYRANETYWNWAAATGRAAGGAVVGFNLTAHRPWKGAKGRRSEHDDPEAEDAADCALWLAGERIKVQRADFHYNSRSLMDPWRITDRDGLVDLHFAPCGERHDDINLGLIVSQFHQPFGEFSGTLRNRTGDSFELDGLYGVTEQHFARW